MGLLLLFPCAMSCAMSPLGNAEDLHFAYGSAEITPYDRHSVDEYLAILANNVHDIPPGTINVCGYTDKAEVSLEDISLRRATAVKTYLEQKGVSIESIRVATFCYHPRDPWLTDPGSNRRVELGVRPCTGQQ